MDDPHFNTEYNGIVAYGQSKTANVLFAVELDRRWAGYGIRGYSLHPGQIVGTNLAPWLGEDELRSMGLIDDSGQQSSTPTVTRRRHSRAPAPACSWRPARCSLRSVGCS